MTWRAKLLMGLIFVMLYFILAELFSFNKSKVANKQDNFKTNTVEQSSEIFNDKVIPNLSKEETVDNLKENKGTNIALESIVSNLINFNPETERISEILADIQPKHKLQLENSFIIESQSNNISHRKIYNILYGLAKVGDSDTFNLAKSVLETDWNDRVGELKDIAVISSIPMWMAFFDREQALDYLSKGLRKEYWELNIILNYPNKFIPESHAHAKLVYSSAEGLGITGNSKLVTEYFESNIVDSIYSDSYKNKIVLSIYTGAFNEKMQTLYNRRDFLDFLLNPSEYYEHYDRWRHTTEEARELSKLVNKIKSTYKGNF